jgi:hypothetical protein
MTARARSARLAAPLASSADIDKDRARRLADTKRALARIQKLAKPGDLLTYTICAGCIREAVFVGVDGFWVVGDMTNDTLAIDRVPKKDRRVNDIGALSVTHINRIPLDAVPMLAETFKPGRVSLR